MSRPRTARIDEEGRHRATGHSPTRDIIDLGMAEEELHRSKIAGAAINQRSLGPPQRMRSKQAGIETDVVNPTTDETRILPGG